MTSKHVETECSAKSSYGRPGLIDDHDLSLCDVLSEPFNGEILLGGASDRALCPDRDAPHGRPDHPRGSRLRRSARARPAPREATDRELWQALDRANADAWVLAVPDRLQTIVGHGGHCTSAAQAQQLPVARPVLADPPMAIPDQATADAGSSGVREPEAAAESVLEGAGTRLDIAHRLTQAPATDRIVAPHAGGVSDSGTHHGCMREHARAAADTTHIVVLI